MLYKSKECSVPSMGAAAAVAAVPGVGGDDSDERTETDSALTDEDEMVGPVRRRAKKKKVSIAAIRAAIADAGGIRPERRVPYSVVMEQYRKDHTRVRQHLFDKDSLTTVQCGAYTDNGTGRRCRNKTTIYPMYCWLHTQTRSGLKLIRSHIKDGGVGLQTLRRIRVADTSDGVDYSESIAEFTGKEREDGDEDIEGAFIVGNKVTFDSQHGIARLANSCQNGNVVSIAERKRVEAMTGRPMGCRDTNMKIYTDDDTKRTYLLASRNIEKNEELLVQYEPRDPDDDLDEVDDGVGADWPEDGPLGFGEYEDGHLVHYRLHTDDDRERKEITDLIDRARKTDLDKAPDEMSSEYPTLSVARVIEIRAKMAKSIRDDTERKKAKKLGHAGAIVVDDDDDDVDKDTAMKHEKTQEEKEKETSKHRRRPWTMDATDWVRKRRREK